MIRRKRFQRSALIDIRKLAQHLNISIGTVSRALNNKAGVHPETRQRVLNAAVELGYVANQSGRSLRRGSTNSIGFVIETGSPANQSGDNFFFVVTDAMNSYLSLNGYDLVILPCHSADDPVEFLARVVARGTVDALVITATRRQDRRIELLARSKMPFLTLGRSETAGDYPFIDLDFEGVARRSVAELLALGHRRIAVAVPDNDAAMSDHFLRGYGEGLAAAGFAQDDKLIMRVSTSEQGGYDFGRKIAGLNPRPTAALLCSEATTVGLYGALATEGMIAGQDLSVITFRENPQMRFLNPAPARHRLSLADLGQAIGTAVLGLLTGDADRARQTGIIWPMEFVADASIGPVRPDSQPDRPL